MKVVLLGLMAFAACSAVPAEEGEYFRKGKSGIAVPPNLLTRDAINDLPRNNEVCGIRRKTLPDMITKIVGGDNAEKHEFPWQVSLQWRYGFYTYHVCGASVLDQNWVITAAHCTHQFQANDLLVIAGDHKLKEKEGNEQSRYIKQIIEHQNYNAETQENDIALIELASPLVMDGMTVSPACLPPPMTNFTGSCVVTGWGKLSETGRAKADTLQKVIVPIVSDKDCEDLYRVIGYTGPIRDTMLCAGEEIGGKDACQGDSGGPFVCKGLDNRYYLAGIVSWGVGCARPNVPGVYTEVSRYIGWIDNVVNNRIQLPARAASLRIATIDQAEEMLESA